MGKEDSITSIEVTPRQARRALKVAKDAQKHPVRGADPSQLHRAVSTAQADLARVNATARRIRAWRR